VIYIEEKGIELSKKIELANRVLINIKKEEVKKLLSLFSLLLLLLLLLISKVIKASSKSLIILPLKLIIYYL
jgi:hypothetical protein